MQNPIDPESLKRSPSRSLQDIATDIFCFPMNLPAGVKFDSSMRLPADETYSDHFGNYLQMKIEDAPRAAQNVDQRSLLSRLSDGKVPKKLRALPDSPETMLGYSEEAMRKLHSALSSIMTTGKAEKNHIAVIQKAAYSIVALNAQVDLGLVAAARKSKETPFIGVMGDMLAGITDKSVEESHKSHCQQQDEIIANFEGCVRNLREGITPLLEELASALNVTLDKGAYKA